MTKDNPEEKKKMAGVKRINPLTNEEEDGIDFVSDSAVPLARLPHCASYTALVLYGCICLPKHTNTQYLNGMRRVIGSGEIKRRKQKAALEELEKKQRVKEERAQKAQQAYEDAQRLHQEKIQAKIEEAKRKAENQEDGELADATADTPMEDLAEVWLEPDAEKAQKRSWCRRKGAPSLPLCTRQQPTTVSPLPHKEP